MADDRPFPDRSAPTSRSSTSSVSAPPTSTDNDWLAMLRAPPWRRQFSPPRPPPPPLSGQFLHQENNPRHQEHFSDHGAQASPLRRTMQGRPTSTALRFLSRQLPYPDQQRARTPPLRQLDHREDRQAELYASERSDRPAVLPSLRRWVNPAWSTGPLPSLADRHSLSSYSDTTLPSSGSSTPIEANTKPIHTLTPFQDLGPQAWPRGTFQPTQPSLDSRAVHSVRRGPPSEDTASTNEASRDAARPTEPTNKESGVPPSSTSKKKKKRTPRTCTTPGCDKLVVDHGVCIRHGGGKRCNVEGCTCRAQNKGLCWKHGGYTICKIDGCDKRAKSRGMCWSHGGGTQCKTDGCEKIAVSRGCCWAHGGGKRCKVVNCKKPAALRMDDYCAEHHAQNRAAQTQQSSPWNDSDPSRLFAQLQETKPRR